MKTKLLVGGFLLALLSSANTVLAVSLSDLPGTGMTYSPQTGTLNVLPPPAATPTAPGVATLGAPGGSAQFGDARFSDSLNFASGSFGTTNASGSGDNSGALNAALQMALSPVVIPIGTFRLTHPIRMGHGQVLRCDSRTTTHILVDQGFDPDATGVIIGPHSEPGPIVEGCDIQFVQPSDQTSRGNFLTLAQGCTSGPGGTGCKYPPAFDFRNDARFRIERSRISGAWDGVNAQGNTGGHYINDLEVGALDVGVAIGGAGGPSLDFCHWRGIHAWPFGFSSTMVAGIYADGQTRAVNLGRCDGLSIVDLQTLQASVHVLSDNLGATISNLGLDTDQSQFIVDPGANTFITLTSAYTSAASVGLPAFQINSGFVSIVNPRTLGASIAPQFDLVGGRTQIIGAAFLEDNAAANMVHVHTGATFLLRDSYVQTAGGAHTAPMIQVDCGGVADIRANKWITNTDVSGVGTAVNLACDDPRHVVADNDFGGWAFTLPVAAINGQFGPNLGLPDRTFTPGILIAGNQGVPAFNGTVTPPVYAKQVGWYHYTSDGAEGDISLVFNTQGYGATTPAAGNLAIGYLPFSVAPTLAPYDGSRYTATVKNHSMFLNDAGFSQMTASVQAPGNTGLPPNIIILQENGSSVPLSGLSPATMPASVNGYQIDLHFSIARS